MANFSDVTENKLIDHIFRGVAYTAPTTLYVSLHTTATTDAGGGTEVSGGSYARVAVTPNSTNFANTQNSGTGVSTGTGGQTSNLTAFTFPAPTANWGTISHIAFWDASSAGNMVVHGALAMSKTVNNGDPAPVISIGAFTFTIA